MLQQIPTMLPVEEPTVLQVYMLCMKMQPMQSLCKRRFLGETVAHGGFPLEQVVPKGLYAKV